jgi:hypothetical protein
LTSGDPKRPLSVRSEARKNAQKKGKRPLCPLQNKKSLSVKNTELAVNPLQFCQLQTVISYNPTPPSGIILSLLKMLESAAIAAFEPNWALI